MFETVVNVEKPDADIVIQEEADDLDGLNYLSWKRYGFC